MYVEEKTIEDKEKIVVSSKVKEREEGIELLRIIAMFMVLLLHYSLKGEFLKIGILKDAKVEIAWLIEAFSIVAVNCYILITGYFLVNSKKNNTKKILKLVGLVLFYSISICLIFIIGFKEKLSIKQILGYIFPTALMTYWFITCYVVLYLLAPYINIVLKNIDKKSYEKLLIILLLISWGSSILYRYGFNVLDATKGYGIIWVVTLYALGGYIKLHITDKSNKYIYLLLYVLISIIVYGTRLIGLRDIFYTYNSITITLSSICLFMFFKKLKINCKTIKSIILKLSPLTIAVYVIHAHPLISEVLYDKVLHTDKVIVLNDFIIGIFISSIGIFTFCCIAEWIRRKLSISIINYCKKTKCYNIYLTKFQKKMHN